MTAPPAVGRLQARLRLSYPGFELDVDLDLPGRGVSTLLGPSGCGKTTLLRALAGLVRARGRVVSNGECWQDDDGGARFVPTHRRALGYVFQEASLFAHLSVLGNLHYGLRRVPRAERRIALEPIVDLMGIGPLLGRRAEGLSGGERQRVAIARALLASPRLLLMDEPLSALDGPRKAEILPYLEKLPRELDLPIVYVTHALDEAVRLADHLVLMKDGRVQAAGLAEQMMSRLDLPTSHAEEASAILEALVIGHEEAYGQTRLQIGADRVWVAQVAASPGDRVRVRIAARDVSVALSRPVGSSIANILAAQVEAVRVEGPERVMLRLRLAGGDAPATHLLARITRRSLDELGLREGLSVFAQVKGVALMA